MVYWGMAAPQSTGWQTTARLPNSACHLPLYGLGAKNVFYIFNG